MSLSASMMTSSSLSSFKKPPVPARMGRSASSMSLNRNPNETLPRNQASRSQMSKQKPASKSFAPKDYKFKLNVKPEMKKKEKSSNEESKDDSKAEIKANNPQGEIVQEVSPVVIAWSPNEIPSPVSSRSEEVNDPRGSEAELVKEEKKSVVDAVQAKDEVDEVEGAHDGEVLEVFVEVHKKSDGATNEAPKYDNSDESKERKEKILYFRSLLETETGRLSSLCHRWEDSVSQSSDGISDDLKV